MNTKSVINKTHCLLSRVFVVNRRQALRRIVFVIFFLLFVMLCHAVYKFLTRDIEIEGWGINVSRNATDYVHPTRDTSFSHADQNICAETKPLVVIIVCSDTKHWKLRQAIRETWAKEARKYNMLVLFMVGISLDEDVNMETLKESVKYKDIIAEEVMDSYNNLTIKSIFMLKWIRNRCMQARFLLKVDDDSYINLGNLYNYTSQIEDEQLKDFLVGEIQIDPVPHRFHFSKWYIPRYMYPADEYPNYLQGVAYLMSTYVAEKIYYESLQNSLIYLEDVFITGICAKQLQIAARDNPLFHFYYRPLSIQCNTNQSQLIVVGHYVDVYRMYRLDHQLSKC